MGLTVKRIERLHQPGRYHAGPADPNLYLQVGDNGARSWIFRYEWFGKERWLGLGSLKTVKLPEARERARRARLMLLDNKDPIEEKRRQRAEAALQAARTMTFAEAARQYAAQHEKSWSNDKHKKQFTSTLEAYVMPKIGKMSVADVAVGDVLRCIEPIWNTKAETASRVRGRVERILDWCQARGLRAGDNPARWSALKTVLPAPSKVAPVEHHAALAYASLPFFMEKLRTKEGVAARALELTVLTAARTSEILLATWSEFDVKGRVWTIPPSRMKARKAHRIPLSDAAVALLQSLPRENGSDLVFLGSKKGAPLSNMSMSAVMRRMGYGQYTVHGTARAGFKTWASERTSFATPIIEMALAHTISDKVEAAYHRSDLLDQRRRLMAQWADFLSKPEAKAANVTAIRAAE